MKITQQMKDALANFAKAKEVDPYRSELLRDAWRVGHLSCRLTLGTMAMLSDAGNKFWSVSGEVEDRDYIQFALITSDEWRGDCVLSIAHDGIDALTDTFTASLSRRKRRAIVSDIGAMVEELDKYNVDGLDDESEQAQDGKWWLRACEFIASQYHWDEHYILWELPSSRAFEYIQMASERLSGDKGKAPSMTPEQMSKMQALMETMKEAREDGTQSKA